MTLSNIGDVVLTFPVIDQLCAAFPDARIHCIVGPKAASLLEGNPCIARVIPYDKKMPWQRQVSWIMALRGTRFGLVVDLRNSMMPFFMNAATITAPVLGADQEHRRDKHLARLVSLGMALRPDAPRKAVFFSPGMRERAAQLVNGADGYVLVAPGAADHRKRWREDGFLEVVRHILARGKKVVLVGDSHDAAEAGRIAALGGDGVTDVCGRTGLLELAAVIDRAELALTNDSGIMHVASYLDKPVVALFGPTDPSVYGPWSSRCSALRQGSSMEGILAADVIAEVDQWL